MTKGQHKVTVTVEIDGGEMVISQSQEFSGGNPIFHSREFFGSVVHPIRKIKKAIKAVYGEPKDESKPIVYGKGIEDVVEQAKENGARVFRFVLIKDGITFTGEALYTHQFLSSWERLQDDINLHRVEYGVPTDTKFEYTWQTL